MSLKIQKRILRLAEVIKITGLGRSTIYGLMKDKKFPQNFYLSKRSVGWLESEIYSWLIDRIDQPAKYREAHHVITNRRSKTDQNSHECTGD